ncbi:unnamed protein product [Cylicocyclus nassatus]|uniref:Actin maturation protease n=1 Tax=Cylicocyclus nassatus TaxID=53992 RepID=A0AA36GG87_CYLNA|nr:unnamed protein product [Cylicocyclus nassatus]
MLDVISSIPPLVRSRIEEVLSRHADLDSTSLPGGYLRISALDPIAQSGPQCGLVALSMASRLLHLKSIEIIEIFEKARKLGISAQGEIFSASWLCELSRALWPVYAEVLPFPEPNELVQLLMNGCALLIPYDCDKNHEPALRNGHGAHWALLVGFLIVKADMTSLQPATSDTKVVDTNNLYVFAYHGKSRYMGLWSYTDLQRSSKQLNEPSPSRQPPDFIIPEDGLSQLREKCVCIKNKPSVS